MTRGGFAVLLCAAVLAACLFVVWLLPEETPWRDVARLGCTEGVFGMPVQPFPTALASLLGTGAPAKAAQLRDAISVGVHELSQATFPDTRVNLNCEQGPFDENMINVYVIARDPNGTFAWARGAIAVNPAAPNVIVMGEDFGSFFLQAWQPILSWREEVSDPDFLRSLGDYGAELYEVFLEWAIAHELGHLKLGHIRSTSWSSMATRQRIELEADIHAARLLRANSRMITPALLGLINETMKGEFARTNGRPWTDTDGAPFRYDWRRPETGFVSSSWRVRLDGGLGTHPPFLLRSISMLEAASAVAVEDSPDSRWSRAVHDLSRHLRNRVDVDTPWFARLLHG